MKEVVDLVMSGKETLCLPRRLEALHLSFASSGRLVRILGSVIQALVLPVLNAGRDLLLRGPIAGQLVRDQNARRPALPLQQLAQEPFGGPLAAMLAGNQTAGPRALPFQRLARGLLGGLFPPRARQEDVEQGAVLVPPIHATR